MAKIKLEHVSMRFGDFYAVKDINLEVEEGEYITILGPSGCGKTSLIRVISGIWTPTEGRVYIDDTDVTDVPLEDRDVGYVFQNIALFPNMNNMKNVEYGPRVRAKSPKEREQTAGKYLQLVNMLDRAQMTAHPAEAALLSVMQCVLTNHILLPPVLSYRPIL